MKHTYDLPNWLPFLVAFFLILYQYPLQATELPLKSKIEHVTVFLQGAQVSRQADVSLQPGEHTLVLSGLPAQLNPASIQVGGTGDLIVLGVTHEIDYLNKQEKSTEVASLETQIESIKAQIEQVQARLYVLDKEEGLILANQQLGGEQQGVSIEALRQAAAFYRQRLQEISLAKLEMRGQLEKLQKQQQDTRKALAEFRVKLNEPSSKIVIQLRSARAQKAELEISYLLENAGWFPTYDVRIEAPGKPLQLAYKARVFQQTGEDWEKVKLSISTGNPKTNNNLPALESSRVNFPEFVRRYGRPQGPITRVSGRVISATDGIGLPGVAVRVKDTPIGTTTDFDGNYSLNVPTGAQVLSFSSIGFSSQDIPIRSEILNVRLEEDVRELQEVVIVTESLSGKVAGVHMDQNKKETKIRGMASLPTPEVVSVENTVSTEFEIKEVYSLASDGKERVVEIQLTELPADYRYYVAPELEEAAYLAARVSGWEHLSLLQGEASLYFEGKYVGKSLLDPLAVSDTLEFALGADKQVIVQREQLSDYTEKQLLGSKRKETRAYQLNIKNNRSQPIALKVEERYPVSANENIQVELEESSQGKVNADSGKISWNLNLQPKQSQELNFRYSLRYPAGKKVVVY